MNIKVDGMDELKKILKKCPEQAKKAAAAELKTDLLDLQGKAQNLAPKEFGDLEGSGHSGVENNSSGINGFVAFDVPYATRQHEEVTWHHTKGQAKYLEQPLKENINDYIKAIGDAIERELEKNG